MKKLLKKDYRKDKKLPEKETAGCIAKTTLHHMVIALIFGGCYDGTRKGGKRYAASLKARIQL